LAGPKAFVDAARFKRKIMGGAMRQAGILAAAGILALTSQTACLAEDHRRAKELARGLAGIPGLEVQPPDINMLFFTFPPARNAAVAERIAGVFKDRGIIINPPDDGVFRFVTHYWIGDGELETILRASREAFRD
jgi:threonine aldolase